MIREIEAKTLLSSVKQPDEWFGLKYNMNLYRGCQHQCIYCDSRSECYQIENFADILVKANAVELLERELSHKRIVGTIGTGSMNDPYMPVEERFNLTGQALKVIARYGFPVHILTKSHLVLKDLDTLQSIKRVYAAVSFTITTADDSLGRKVEPGAPLVSERLRAMRILAEHGILTGALMMPILPFIEDNEENISAVISKAKEAGATYIIPWIGMSLRDRQRDYYYVQLDRLFPGLRQRYQRAYGERYTCPAPRASQLERHFHAECTRLDLLTRMPVFTPHPRQAAQPGLFEDLPGYLKESG